MGYSFPYRITHITDQVEIVGDISLWELFRYDHKVLPGLKALYALARKEAVQSLCVSMALYINHEAFP